MDLRWLDKYPEIVRQVVQNFVTGEEGCGSGCSDEFVDIVRGQAIEMSEWLATEEFACFNRDPIAGTGLTRYDLRGGGPKPFEIGGMFRRGFLIVGEGTAVAGATIAGALAAVWECDARDGEWIRFVINHPYTAEVAADIERTFTSSR